MKEQDILRSIMRLSTGAVRLFRNNIGVFWTGRIERIGKGGMTAVAPGDVVIRSARPVSCGLQEGSGDLIGWRSVVVTPDMVGQRLAVFVSIEVKSERGRVRESQENWASVVDGFGGIAIVARSVESVEKVLTGINS